MEDSKVDFISAFESEMGVEPTPAETPEEPADDKKTDEQVTTVENKQDEPQEEVTPDEAEQKHEEETPTEVEEPKLTQESIKDAIREVNQEAVAKVDLLKETAKGVIDVLYPQGINRTIYDSNGTAVKTAQDIVDRKLINAETGEEYTYEEAVSFLLESNRKMDSEIAELDKYAESIAEKNISLSEGNARVMAKHGELLKAMPALAKDLAEKYVNTQLKFDKTNSYIEDMRMAPEEFYDLVLAPYSKMNEAIARNAELEASIAEAKKAEEARKVAEQNERLDMPGQMGTSSVKANTGNAFVDALVDEFNK